MDVFGGDPLYVRSDGIADHRVESLLNECSAVSLEKLAHLLSRPVLYGDYLPDTPWTNISRIRDPIRSWPEHDEAATDLRAAFYRAIEAAIAPHERIAVSVSGGLDSAAVLAIADEIARCRDKTLIAVTARITSDQSIYAPDLAARVVTAVNPRMKHVLVDPLIATSKAVWPPAGPRLEAMPAASINTALAAKAEGCEIILLGSGADELMGTPRFLSATMLRRGRFADFRAYVADVGLGGAAACIQEAFGAFVAPWLSQRSSTRAYWAVCWPDVLNDLDAPAVLCPPFKEAVAHWSRRLLEQELMHHMRGGLSWAESDAWDGLFPHDIQPAVSDLREYSPFLDPSFGLAALRTPLSDRYRRKYKSHYFRRKRLVCDLLPAHVLEVIHPEKQLFSGDFARITLAMSRDFEACFDLRLLERNAVMDASTDALVICTCRAIEEWLSAAHGRPISRSMTHPSSNTPGVSESSRPACGSPRGVRPCGEIAGKC